MMQEIRIGTRSSKLALWQANYVKSFLEENFPHCSVEIKKFKTTGDLNLKKNLDTLGGRGAFVKEIQNALINNEIDLAVHSYKDLPTENPSQLEIISVSPREDERDVLISKNKISLNKLKKNSLVCTGSNRRTEQIKILRNDVLIEPIRGNIDTRIKKVIDGNIDAIIIAAAGVRRLGLSEYITEYFSISDLVPSPLQGFIAIEAKKGGSFNDFFKNFVSSNDLLIARLERKALELLNGSCDLPFGFNIQYKNSKFICSYFIKYNNECISGEKELDEKSINDDVLSLIKKISLDS